MVVLAFLGWGCLSDQNKMRVATGSVYLQYEGVRKVEALILGGTDGQRTYLNMWAEVVVPVSGGTI